ncbi:MAG: FMN-binding protein [Spirochaetes bacterium]|nr:FMN-binding protein [Spirochaetota bacterium]
MKNSVHVIVFAGILAVVCSILLYAVTQFTEPFRKMNEETDKDRNFLSALGVPIGKNVRPKELLGIFDKNIKVRKLGKITIYEYIPETSASGKPVAVAVPFSGAGFWAPIKGVLAFEPDLLTIRGIRFYQQEETPGLGGEIASKWFQNEFKGKKIVSNTGEAGFKIVKSGEAAGVNAVDAITGATRTSERVQIMLNRVAKELYKERKNYVR